MGGFQVSWAPPRSTPPPALCPCCLGGFLADTGQEVGRVVSGCCWAAAACRGLRALCSWSQTSWKHTCKQIQKPNAWVWRRGPGLAG